MSYVDMSVHHLDWVLVTLCIFVFVENLTTRVVMITKTAWPVNEKVSGDKTGEADDASREVDFIRRGHAMMI